ncbi:hypothetical protein ACEUZ9_002771 [Paracoccus litorisediminis]|uniref:hypothetical protein n=1 Tax=Paracoccus litorisediminis TaxID=2006130 RepID=UPI003731E300
MIRYPVLLALAFLPLCPAGTMAAEIASHEFKDEHDQCTLRMEVASGPRLKLAAWKSSTDGVPNLELTSSNIVDELQPYLRTKTVIQNMQLLDSDAVEEALPGFTMGGRAFRADHVGFYGISRDMIDEKVWIEHRMETQKGVSEVLEALKQDGISVPGLYEKISGTAASVEEFRDCAYQKLGFDEGDTFDTDFRAHYRMAFEKALPLWIENLSWASSCGQMVYVDAEIDETLERAAGAFYPGILKGSRRSEYISSFGLPIATAKLSGTVKAMKDGCLAPGLLARTAKSLVEETITSAEKLD